MAQPVNHELLPDNACYGCGPFNPHGVQITIERDPTSSDRLEATFAPRPHMVGFPGITHGGVLFTALDCLAAWVPSALRPGAQPMRLVGTIASEGGPEAPMVVHTEAHGEDGALLAAADFKVVPVSEERFLQITGLPEIPPNWRAFLQRT